MTPKKVMSREIELPVPRYVRHSAGPDDVGGLWFVVTLADHPGWQFGAYFDQFLRFAGFSMSPLYEGSRLLTSPTPVGGLTTRGLRAVPLGAVEREARLYMRELALGNLGDALAEVTILDAAGEVIGKQPLFDGGGPGSPWALEAKAAADAGNIEIVRTGRKGTDDLVYARAAALYVALLRTGPKPIERMAAEMTCSIPQARNLVAKARAKELLTREGQGRAGGELTQLAIDILEGTQ